MESGWEQSLNVDTLVLCIVFAFATCTTLFFAKRK